MTLGADSLWLYAGAMVAIWLTPGPVWVAIMARALASGFRGVWPLAMGVAIGDMLWPLIAIFGLAVLVGQHAVVMEVMGWVAAVVFVGMGVMLLRHAADPVAGDSRRRGADVGPGFPPVCWRLSAIPRRRCSMSVCCPDSLMSAG